jgi:hypothetical protein
MFPILLILLLIAPTIELNLTIRVHGTIQWNEVQHWSALDMTGPGRKDRCLSPSDWDNDCDVDLKDFALVQQHKSVSRWVP